MVQTGIVNFEMTRHELETREKILLGAYRDNDLQSVMQMFFGFLDKYKIENLYRFRPPKDHDLDALDKGQIFLAKPKTFEDKEDCQLFYNIPELMKYDVTERSRKKYQKYQNIFDDDFYRETSEKVMQNPKYAALIEEERNECLVACMTDKITDFMWNSYAASRTGFCLEYDIRDVVNQILKMEHTSIIPVRYVDDRKQTEDIYFTSEDFKDDEKMQRKYRLSCMTKNKVPYVKEREWRILESDVYDLEEDGRLTEFIFPKKIYLGKNMSEEYKLKLTEIATKHNIQIERGNKQ